MSDAILAAIDAEIQRLQAFREQYLAGRSIGREDVESIQRPMSADDTPWAPSPKKPHAARAGRRPGAPPSAAKADSLRQIAEYVAQRPGGVQAGDIGGATGLDGRTLTRRLSELVQTGQLRKKGGGRTTTYFPPQR